jgi:hypothetical protein
MMNIYWRWLKLVFTCGLGRHAERVTTMFPHNIRYMECPRCHDAYYGAHEKSRVVHLRPPLWDVARGLYDKGIQP